MIQKVYETSWGHKYCIRAGGLLCDHRMIPYCGAVGKVGYLLRLATDDHLGVGEKYDVNL